MALNSKLIEQSTRIISILSVLFLIGAVVGEGLYYQAFGLNIFSYTSLSEIISIFINSIPILLLVSATVMIYAFFISHFLNTRLERMFNVLKLNRRERKKQLFKSLNITAIVMTVWMTIVFLFPSFNFISRKFILSEGYFFLKAIAHYLIVLWFFISTISVQSEFTTEYHKLGRYGIFFIVTFFISIYFKTRYEILMVHVNPNYFSQISITLKEGKPIFSDSTTLFIGKTNDYVFIHYSNNQIPFTKAIKMDDIREIYYFKYIPRVTFP